MNSVMSFAGIRGDTTSVTPPPPICATAARSEVVSKGGFDCKAWLTTVPDALPNSSV